MLNASVGFQRVLGRLRRPKHHRLASTRTPGSPRPAVGHALRRGLHSVVAASRLVPQRHPRTTVSRPAEPRRRSYVARLGPDRAVAAAVVAVLLGASVLSFSAGRPVAATGGPTGDGSAPRIAVGGDVQDQDRGSVDGTGDVQFAQPEMTEAPLGDFAAIDIGADQVRARGPGRGRRTVHRRRDAGQADRGRHDRPRRQRPAEDLHGQGRRHPRRRSPRSSTSRR